MKIPDKFDKILKQDQAFHAAVMSVATSFEPIYRDNKLYFFEEYTDHGIDHVEKVLTAANLLITEESYQFITPKEIGLLILSILLHDIGMHLEYATFKAFIDGVYDDVRIEQIDSKTWKDLWNDYLVEARHFSSLQKENIFGDSSLELTEPNLNNKDSLTGIDKKFIGEFIRRHHARISHEIALTGFVKEGNIVISLDENEIEERDRQLAGIIARSHGLNIRDTFVFLEHIGYGMWKFPGGHNVIFLMVLLRLADYLQIDKNRTSSILLKLKTFSSPVSLLEHQSHLDIDPLGLAIEEPELISVICEPRDARMYVKLQELISDIQYELDMSWAILGEIYGFNPTNRPQIKYRRIKSNLKHQAFLDKIDYIPQKISFIVNNELSKLLVAPLYGNKPTYGVRELVQNATDACKEYAKIAGTSYEPLVVVSVEQREDGKWEFRIQDNGKGMTLDEILSYFLVVGSSFRNSYQWKKEFEQSVTRNGRFGIGVLAAFLIGDEIHVRTKSDRDRYGYSFSTKIDGVYLDIKRELTNEKCGTEIIISMSEENIDYFKKDETSYNDGPRWSEWYVDDSPKVVYLFDSKIIKSNQKFSTIRPMRSISPSDYRCIKWGYRPSHEWGGPSTFIACNGIKITASSKNSVFSKYENWWENYIIRVRPSLFIEDYLGILPVRLDRNDIDAVDLSFDDELFLDISKEFIASLLTLKISKEDGILKNTIHPHETEFIYTRDGYCLASDYTLRIFQKKHSDHRIIRVIGKYRYALKMDDFNDIDDKIAIIPTFQTDIKLSNQTANVAPDCGGRVLLKKSKFDNLFLSDKSNRLANWARRNYSEEWKDENYITYNVGQYNMYSKPAIALNDNRYCSFLEDDNIQSIQELPLEYLNKFKYRCGETLASLMKKYIGENVIIPYDMSLRKKLYALAFDELKDYMIEI